MFDNRTYCHRCGRPAGDMINGERAEIRDLALTFGVTPRFRAPFCEACGDALAARVLELLEPETPCALTGEEIGEAIRAYVERNRPAARANARGFALPKIETLEAAEASEEALGYLVKSECRTLDPGMHEFTVPLEFGAVLSKLVIDARIARDLKPPIKSRKDARDAAGSVFPRMIRTNLRGDWADILLEVKGTEAIHVWIRFYATIAEAT